jgi:hypothetical protein
LRVILAKVCQSNALVGELDALAWRCHCAPSLIASRTPPHAASGPPWSAVEYVSTHPHNVRLRRAPAGGNEVGVRAARRIVDIPNRRQPTTRASSGLSGRAARGSVSLRKMACRSRCWEEHLAVQGHRPALEGQPRGCPFVVGRGGGLAVGCATAPTHTRRTPA